jgi:hypothetical protein
VRHITPGSGTRAATLLLLAVVALAGLLAFVPPSAALRGVGPSGLLRDFSAFYCAGSALRHGADPYLEEPLGSCERAPKPAPLLPGTPALAMPAPLPPYALAPFAVLSLVPYAAAGLVWSLVLAASVAATVFALRRLTGLPLLAIVAAFVLGDGYAMLCLGQLAPVAVAAVALAALLLASGRDEAAALAAAGTMLEPHVGLPVCIALFVWRPRTRLPLGCAALFFAALSFALAGPGPTLEYFSDVVPAHALSEIANEKQLSLTYALHRLGVADTGALDAGELWYGAMLLLGVGAAGRALRHGAGASFVAVLPPLFVVVGGPFVHIAQTAAALPAALLLYARANGAQRRTLGVALAALAVPWLQFPNLGTSFAALAALVCGILIAKLVDPRPLAAGVAGVLAILFLAGATALLRTHIGDAGPALAAHYDPRALAETSWRIYVNAIGSANAPAFDLAKVPSVAGLLAVACCALASLRPAKTEGAFQTIASTGNGGDASRRIALR